MELFLYNSTYEIWICTAPSCQYAVSPTTFITHLRTRHGSHPNAATPALQQAALTAMLQQPWINPEHEIVRFPPPSSPPILGLPVYRGYGCPYYEYICRCRRTMDKHRDQNHADRDGARRKRGRETIAQTQARLRARLAERIVSCQRFFISRSASRFFEVTCAEASPD